MRNQKRRFRTPERPDDKPLKPKSRLGVYTLFAAAICGLLFAWFHWRGSRPETPTVVADVRAAASTTEPMAPESSLNTSQEVARLFLASTKVPKFWTNYVGDEACLPCHQEMATAYHQTAHYHTSTWPTKDSIHGSFSPDSNVLQTGNTNLVFKMDANQNGFFQTAVLKVSPTEATQYTARIDVVIGSGRKGQTFLYWRGDRLFELPVSYWVERHTWMNSPNFYPDGTANFGRPIAPRCLECHVTSFDWLDPFEKPVPVGILRFNRYTNVVVGLACEKCHGPGGEHIARFRSASPPKSPDAMAIVNPARLPRDRQMDACGLCHEGSGTELSPALTFQVGDVLTNHLELPTPGADAPVDVHGNQVRSLERSRCFRSSPTMTCVTCHDVHKPQRDLKAFAARCLTCHQVESCGEFARLGHAIDSQCVVCHMPAQRTQVVQAVTKGEKFQPQFYNHQIAIYPDVRLP
jgi:hypothetical protein